MSRYHGQHRTACTGSRCSANRQQRQQQPANERRSPLDRESGAYGTHAAGFKGSAVVCIADQSWRYSRSTAWRPTPQTVRHAPRLLANVYKLISTAQCTRPLLHLLLARIWVAYLMCLHVEGDTGGRESGSGYATQNGVLACNARERRDAGLWKVRSSNGGCQRMLKQTSIK